VKLDLAEGQRSTHSVAEEGTGYQDLTGSRVWWKGGRENEAYSSFYMEEERQNQTGRRVGEGKIKTVSMIG